MGFHEHDEPSGFSAKAGNFLDHLRN